MKKFYFLAISIISYVFVGAVNHSVTTVGNTFSPANININLGDTVTWTNGGGSHNVNATLATYPNNPEGFGNSISSSSWSFQHIFSIAGTYDYQCDPHTSMGMVGTVVVQSNTPSALTFTSIMDLTVPSSAYSHSCSNCNGKAIMLTANQSISDLSIYGIGSASNGGGTDGQEYTFPSISLNAGQHIILTRDSAALSTYFDGCLEQFSGAMHPTVIIENQSGEPSGNGNDAYELFENNVVIETFGDITHSYGTGGFTSLSWAYRDSWAWKDTALSNVGNWIYGGDNCSDGSTTTQTSSCPFPLATTACGSTTSPALVGTWKLSPVGGALAVGNQGQGSGNWWSSPLSEVTNRACIFDDSIKLEANGNMTHYMDGSTWLETWQGVSSEQCGSPVAPHDGGSDTWSFANNQLTVNGVGAHFGLPKAYNGGELNASSTVPASRTYEISFSTDSSQMYLDILSAGGGTGWWRFIYQKTSSNIVTSYDVTLSVNMSNETGVNTVYAGGGVLGNAQAVQLSDPDGDATWTGVATFPVAGGNYIFLKNPANGGDWGTKESLVGQSCADNQNNNDRLMPAITSDTTVLHCWETCVFDGSCPSPSTPINYIFQVDMNQSGYDSTATPYLRGSWDWGGSGDMMSDADGDGIWQFTKSLTGGAEYLFAVDTTGSGGWDINESNDPNEPCTNGNAQFTNRVLSVSVSDTTLGIVCLGSCSPCLPPSSGITTELFFSEYAEGSSNNKYIEIYNGTGMPVDLSNYVMMQNSNGGPWDEYTDVLSGILAHDDVYVIANSSADSLILAEADLTGSGICFFNGDDARALVKVVGTDTIVCDYIGEFPTDPGSGWDVAGVTNGTKEHTLVRKSTVCNGDTSWSNSAGTDSINSQWIVLAQNDWTHLGSHTTNCLPQPPPPPPTSSVTVTYSVDVTSYLSGGATLDSSGIRIAGNFADNGAMVGGVAMSSWNPTHPQSAMSDPDGDSIWTITISYDSIGPNVMQYYKFINGNWGTGMEESVNDTLCGGAGGFGSDRFFNIPSMDTTLCYIWNSCSSCGSTINYVDITFTLNTSSIVQLGDTVDPTGMFIAGGGTFGNPGDNPMTDLGNGIWSITVNKPEGFTTDYTFTNGDSGWGAKEVITGLPCAVAPFDDRNLAPVYSDTTIQHCFGTCDYDGTCSSVVIPPTGLKDRINNVLIYPNPANNNLNISSAEIIQRVEILDVVGRKVISKTLNSYNYQLDVSNLNSNVYFINYTINGVINTKKVVVNN